MINGLSDAPSLQMTKDTVEELCRLIETKQVIPVIGYDLFDAEFDSPTYPDVLSFLVESAYTSACADVRTKIDEKIENGFDLVNAVYHSDKISKRTFRKTISDQIVRTRNNVDPIPQSFEYLARIKGFRFYVNATIFNSLESAVNTFKVPKQEEKEVSLVDIVSYHPRNIVDINYNHINDEFSTDNFKKPTIYHWLGIHDRSEGEYVLTDSDYTELLVDMLSNEKDGFSNLEKALKKASLLFIGCDFPDWILRFFVRFCVGDKMTNASETEKILIEKIFDEKSKAFLLSNHRIIKYKTKPDDFVNILFRRLRERNPSNIENSYFNNRVFLSYNHDDMAIAERVFEQLESNNIDVFFDRSLMQGDALSETIERAINDSCAFVPILTEKVNNPQNLHKWYKMEWNHAARAKGAKYIFPLIHNSYNGHTLPGDVYFKETKDIILNYSDTLVRKENIREPGDGDGLPLSADFIKYLKDLQFRSRISKT